MDLSELSHLCERSLMWRSKHSPWRIWLRRWNRGFWMSHLFGRILKPSIQTRFVTKYTSSLPAILANHFRSRAKGRARKTLDTFGQLLRESLTKSNRHGVSSKMSRDIFRKGSTKFIVTLKKWATQLRRDCLAQQKSVLHICGKDCLFWPTIQIADSKMAKANKRGNPHLNYMLRNWPTPQLSEYKGQSQRGQHQPTDRLTNLVIFNGLPGPGNHNTDGNIRGLWATPAVGDCSGNHGGGQARSLRTDVTPARLNPNWVEQLMGLPVGWTDCDCSVTALCRYRQKKPSGVYMPKSVTIN